MITETIPTQKVRPILFSGPMVRAILEGRKSQTRRIVKPQPESMFTRPIFHACRGWRFSHEIDFTVWPGANKKSATNFLCCPYGVAGDQLWVRETWAHVPIRNADGGQGDKMGAIYKADGESAFNSIPDEWEFMEKWRSPYHMPRCASRITLEITKVRVERLQEISEADAKAEGVKAQRVGYCADGRFGGKKVGGYDSYIETFGELWDSINGKDAWDKNPWVWVIDFCPANVNGSLASRVSSPNPFQPLLCLLPKNRI